MPGLPSVTLTNLLGNLSAALHRVELATRPVHPETAKALALRWAELPPGVQTPEQLLGRGAVGCEGTHGVFPACNLTCSPCYHSADANKVRVDGSHTVQQVRAQMDLLRRVRGPRAHAQLIGGEVSLLSPDDHAAALLAMREAGREPMSMTHGDFDPEYLEALVTAADGRLRLRRVSFAAHFDSLMRGRRGIPRPRQEADLDPYRAAFVAMFASLRARRGVRYYLAHNMTVTPENLDQVSGVVRSVAGMGYSMMSFQPAASVGDSRRWSEGMSSVSIDDVWDRLEKGLGQSVAWQGLQFGDPRCNRTAWGLMVDRRWVPLVDPSSPADLRVRDRGLALFGGMNFGDTPPVELAAKISRVALRHPSVIPLAAGWAHRMVRRSGGLGKVLLSWSGRRVTPMTFVVHNFMDAAVVTQAWAATGRGERAEDPEVRAAQERLAACSYAMAHPDTGELVPACVQHSVLDPGENRQLRVLLPLATVRRVDHSAGAGVGR